MPQYLTQAKIIDISKDKPTKNDIFLVDSNVWLWMTYPKIASAPAYATYETYLNNALNVGAHIYYCGLSLSELAHSIEKNEMEIFQRVNSQKCFIKKYRHNSSERTKVISEIDASWNQVKTMAKPLCVNIDKDATDAALKRIQNEKIDGYDLFLLECMKANNVSNIITHDADFATVNNINVFTYNSNTISNAKKKNNIIRR